MKKVGIIKRIFALLLVFLLSINSFAAVVSDNDGSAFITKAEFDSLKNNFQAQIDQYNQSIDSKIDGAIASYLSGIKLDEAKHYQVYGASYGKLLSKKCNAFRLVEQGNGTCYTNSSSLGKEKIRQNHSLGFYTPSYDLTNRGYGVAYWVSGYDNRQYTSLTAPCWGSESLGFICSYYTSKETYSDATNYIYLALAKRDPGYTGSWPSSECYLYRADVWDRLCNMQLSDAFESTISLKNPSFPLYKFLDEGDVTISFSYYAKGADYEGTTRPAGTAESRPAFWQASTGSHPNTVKVQATLHSSSGDTVIHNYITYYNATDKKEGQWVDHTFHVKPGDTINLDVNSYSGGGMTGSYSIFWFSSEIAGWEPETT